MTAYWTYIIKVVKGVNRTNGEEWFIKASMTSQKVSTRSIIFVYIRKHGADI